MSISDSFEFSTSFEFRVSSFECEQGSASARISAINPKPETGNPKLSLINPKLKQTGFSLIEAVIFIVVVAVGLAGVLLAINTATRDSVDPLIRKQATAIAEALIEEIESMPYTFCDPNDPAAPTAVNAAGCATPEAIGQEPGETRYSTTTPFDNVNDYHLFNTATDALPGIRDINGNLITGLAGYNASVTVTAVALNGAPALLIEVTVTGPRGTVVNLAGYRTQYAPNATP